MFDYQDYFKDKKITMMGLGLLGRGVGDAAFLAECGAEVLVTDVKSEAELAESIAELKSFSNITFVLGEHREQDFADRDFILVGAGVPLDSVYTAAARTAQVPLKQSAAWFAELSGVPIIGVTGTRGKSTVTQMIHHSLRLATGETILLGGNVRGVSNLQLFKVASEDSLCVMELDSWQLQGWGWAEISPQVAVFTNFMEDHQNYYQATSRTSDVLSKEQAMERYFADKANIFKNQEGTGVLVTTPEVFALAEEKGLTLKQEVVLADTSVLPEDCLLAMPGEHNRLNAALAYEALKAISLSDDLIFEGLATFGGVEGRLQQVCTHNGVKIYNDNNATTPQATAAGIDAVTEDKNVVLIAGGADKNIAIEDLVAATKVGVKTVVLTPGNGTDRFLAALHDAGMEAATIVVNNLSTAFEEALLAASPGDVILFSPAFASFSQYTNEYERNDEFLNLVAALEE